MWFVKFFVATFFVLTIFSEVISEPSFDEEFDKYEYMNTNVNPCDDFYEYSCGNFKNLYPLKDGQVIIDQFSILEENLTAVVREILESSTTDDDPIALQKAKAAYQACVSTDYYDTRDLIAPEAQVVEKYGGFPILLDGFDQNEKRFDWYDTAAIASDFGINIFFSPSLYYDTANASRNILRITSDGMEIPVQFRTYLPESYEEAIEEGFSEMVNSSDSRANKLKSSNTTIYPMELLLRKFVLKLRNIFGRWESDEYVFDRVANITNFMKGIYAKGYIPPGVLPEPVTNDSLAQTITLKQLNDWTRKHFEHLELDWVKYVQILLRYTQVEVNENFLLVYPTDFHNLTYGILNWVQMNDPAIVKSTALLRAFVYMASDSDSETRNDFETYLKAIGKTVYPRPEYCARKVMDATGTISLSLAVAYEYQLKHFDKSKLDNAFQLITDLQTTFREIIEETDWMDDISKEAAQKKADNIITLLGYPKFITQPYLLDKFYEHVEITRWDHFDNARIMRAFQQAYTLNMISVRNRTAWEKSPFDVNAYYNRQNNRIIFPIAMLNPIFFKGSQSILDYGRIGMVISHEITHGFDSMGFLFNAEGVIEPWWTANTTTNFAAENQCFIDQYSSYIIPEINSTISGKNSLNENLADNGGLRTAFKTLQKLLPRLRSKYGKLLRGAQFTNEQLFFLGYGTMWCTNESLKYIQDLKKLCDTSTSCHFLSKWRVNGVVSNMEEFSKAFNCPVGSPMNPETKCRLW